MPASVRHLCTPIVIENRAALVQRRRSGPSYVDTVLGPPDSWPSTLIAYRLTPAFQAPWTAEVGQWLRAAADLGFLDRVRHELEKQARRPSKGVGIDPNDERHLQVAPASRSGADRAPPHPDGTGVRRI
jgi:hypothetical protein